ncbi:hypothetical protein MLD38_016706 [Melastoma candidum]|uniref:Uncharacterized protein n=2 Tax=Melastoma candidum TaxID=119954 RepID=A0ACB9QNA4_9MYRT|nr:hypothetical protein MLD38_016706 [Melastoma candidum]
MGEEEAPREVQLEIITDLDHDPHHPSQEKNAATMITIDPPPPPGSYKWWFRVLMYSFFVLAGQSVATLLGRLYYDKGGKSKWLETFVQLAGFPLVMPLYWLVAVKSRKECYQGRDSGLRPGMNAPPSYWKLVFVYVSLGVLVAADSFLYSVGLLYLPVSTYSLISSTQLAFNAVFSFFLNSQKFTPSIVNSLVLLTISSTLLVFQPDSSSGSSTNGSVSRAKYMVGFICTVVASAGYGLILSLTQLSFRKVIKRETFKAVLEMFIFQSLVASSIIFIGLFVSGDWTLLKREMKDYKLGEVSYMMTLAWTAISWGIFSVGAIGLISDVSSLFSNSISTVGLPIVPVFAAVFFHDSMDGVKVVSMVLAIWGFISYLYQHYLDNADLKKKTERLALKFEKPGNANTATQ